MTKASNKRQRQPVTTGVKRSKLKEVWQDRLLPLYLQKKLIQILLLLLLWVSSLIVAYLGHLVDRSQESFIWSQIEGTSSSHSLIENASSGGSQRP